LKWAAEKDTEAHNQQMKEQRKTKFRFPRNAEGAKHRALMVELVSLAKEKES